MSRILMPALVVVLCGCATEDAEPVDSDINDEETGIAKQELGEAGCGTISSLFLTGNHGAVHAFSNSTTSPDKHNPKNSPNWLYNLSPSLCPLQFVTEYTSLPPTNAQKALRAAASTYDGYNPNENSYFWSIDNEADCERTRIYYGVYVWNTNTTNPSSTLISHVKGNWSNGACRNDFIGGTNVISVPTGSYKVRVAGRVEFCSSADCSNWGALQTNFRVQTHLELIDVPQ